MLATLGYDSLDALMAAAVPSGIRKDLEGLPDPISESQALADLRILAERNSPGVSMILIL